MSFSDNWRRAFTLCMTVAVLLLFAALISHSIKMFAVVVVRHGLCHHFAEICSIIAGMLATKM